MPFLYPDDIVQEILLRLPTKSLVRFECVSKQWVSLIKNPRFARANLNHHNHNNYSVILSGGLDELGIDTTTIEKVKGDSNARIIVNRKLLPEKFRPPETLGSAFRVICCCNGILLGFVKAFGEDTTLVLWNPTINEGKRIPGKFGWDFNSYCLGFGHDSSHDDYKIVKLPTEKGGIVKLLTLKSNSWRTICNNFPYTLESHGQIQSVNGKLYWSEEETRTILRFDLASETFSEMAIPSACGRGYKKMCSLDGRLCLLSSIGHSNSKDMELWMMEKEEISWVKIGSFSKDELFWDIRPLYFSKAGELVVYKVWSATNDGAGRVRSPNIYFYDPTLMIYKNCHQLINFNDDLGIKQIISYYATLVSPLG